MKNKQVTLYGSKPSEWDCICAGLGLMYASCASFYGDLANFNQHCKI